jgi:mono/diheme cytochrome c family protein
MVRAIGTAATLSACLCALTLGAGAQEPHAPDVSAGRSLALAVCTACHLVVPDQGMEPIPNPPAPPFPSIVNRPGTTAESLLQFMRGSHPVLASPGRMPNPQVTDEQIIDIVGFMITFRTHHRHGAPG